jgi:hypothetical protein
MTFGASGSLDAFSKTGEHSSVHKYVTGSQHPVEQCWMAASPPTQ